MRSKTIKIFSLTLLFLMAISPIAFAAELQTVKVSELKPGQVIVDRNGNEIIVGNISTQAKQFSTISEIINQLVTRNPNSVQSTGNIVTYVGDGQAGVGVFLTGKAITGEAINFIKRDSSYSYYSSKDLYFGVGVTDTNPVEYRVSSSNDQKIQWFNPNNDLGWQDVPPNFETKEFNKELTFVTNLGESNIEEFNPTFQAPSSPAAPSAATTITPEAPAVDLVATDIPESQTASSPVKGFNSLDTKTAQGILGNKYKQGVDYVQAPSGAIYATKNGALGEYMGRGQVQTVFGEMGFGMGQLVQGVEWAATVVGFVQLFGPILGGDQEQVNAISVALGAGIMAGKLSYALLGRGGAGEIVSGAGANGEMGWLGKSVSSAWFSGAVGLGTAWLVYNSMWEKESTKVETVNFQCMPWQAPRGGQDCELCNDPTLPCSEYKCKSLGQSCGIINPGTSAERCVNMNPRDVAPPIIKPLDSALSAGLVYSDVKENPPGAGFKIKSRDVTTGCIKPFSSIEFGVETNEPAQCKIDYVEGKNYSQMATYFSGSNLYEYNHTESLSLPSADSFKNSSLVLENGKELHLYMKCRDAQGNTNEADYALSLCVDPSPDTTSPRVSATSISPGSCVAATSQNSSVSFYINEPAECRWSPQDQSFDSMKNNMTCATSVTEINALQVYTCNTLLTGIAQGGSDFYIRCKDQPLGVNESKRNVNQESYKFSLRGSNPLRMGAIHPNETIFGSVNPMPVELSTSTLFGCDNGQAICYYSTTGGDNSFVKFFDTDKEDGIHTQRLDLSSGTYTYTIKCVDSGGNLAQNSTTFRVEVDPNAPMIARVYEEDSYLKIVTPQNSECFYSNENCDFLNEGTPMPYQNSTTHVTPWISDKTYYIKCMDQFRSLPTDCSLIVKPTENFL